MPNSNSINRRLCIIGESDPFLARLLQRFAEKVGMREVQHARTGDEVMDLVQHNRPALIIMEPELPGKLRGWEAVRLLKTGVGFADIPLMICAWLEKEEALALTGSVAAYLQKPDLHYKDFAAAVELAGVKAMPDTPDRG
jgi:DNA-binding response OmpR family regulator